MVGSCWSAEGRCCHESARELKDPHCLVGSYPSRHCSTWRAHVTVVTMAPLVQTHLLHCTHNHTQHAGPNHTATRYLTHFLDQAFGY